MLMPRFRIGTMMVWVALLSIPMALIAYLVRLPDRTLSAIAAVIGSILWCVVMFAMVAYGGAPHVEATSARRFRPRRSPLAIRLATLRKLLVIMLTLGVVSSAPLNEMWFRSYAEARGWPPENVKVFAYAIFGATVIIPGLLVRQSWHAKFATQPDPPAPE